MRKSQAPSAKTNLVFSSINKDQDSTSSSGNHVNAFRSTENVMSILSELDKVVNDKETSCSDFDLGTDKKDFSKNVEKERSGVTADTNVNFNQKSESSVTIFTVVYGKNKKKKHKTWDGDGTLEVGSRYLTLKDENGKVIGTLPCHKARKLEKGERLSFGSKEVELVELADKEVLKSSPPKKNEKSEKCQLTSGLRKSSFLKKYVPPKLNYSSGIALPEPSGQHQWHFNKKNLPLTPVFIEPSLSNKLRPHQCAGVTFLYECVMGFKKNDLNGAILADEMGLGKTLQCITLIWTLLKQGPYGNEPFVNKVLIVTPSSLTMNWHNEFIKWLGRVKLVPYVVNEKNKPSGWRGNVMIISYEMLIRYIEDLQEHKIDLLICDEGHRLKNSSIRTAQMLYSLNCSRRIILTGTPIQNDLQEFYSLVDFVNPGVLGTPAEYHRRFEEPILASRQPNASEETLIRGKECAQELKRITGMFLLRRTRDILSNYLPPRTEVVVFCKISDVQKTLYTSFIESYWNVKENDLDGGAAHFELISVLRKICNHPLLISNGGVQENFCDRSLNLDDFSGKQDGTKVNVTINLLRELRETCPKEKVVLVSNSTQTLDLLEKIIGFYNYSTCRLDGSTPSSQRNDIVERFNRSHGNPFVFLLSSKAGGVGLNLVGASRLILFDSDWNPATDLQSVSRIWRDGQKYPVYIYRLLTTGTIEEKIYERQISKLGLCEGTVDPETAKSIKLSKEDLKDIFSVCHLEKDSLIHEALGCDCSKQGEIPVVKSEPEEGCGQLVKQSNLSLKISDLFHWEHHGNPFDLDFLSLHCLKSSADDISFIFRNFET